MARQLAQRGFEVNSFAPLPGGTYTEHGVKWYDVRHQGLANPWLEGVCINYRSPALYAAPKPPGATWWYCSQDVDAGGWTDESLAKVDRYLCLCHDHARYTLDRYPSLAKRVYLSSNGVRDHYIAGLEQGGTLPGRRHPRRMFYASSPDRGITLLLREWWRVRERFPDAELRIAYGFDNLDKIVKSSPNDWRVAFKRDMEGLMHQDGITWLGRLPADRVYEEYFGASVYAAPHSFPETSGVAFLDAQACGCIPVTNNYWAIRDNVQHGYKVDGIPQNSDLVKHLWLTQLWRALEGKDMWEENGIFEGHRVRMMSWARRNFSYDRWGQQWQQWLEEDLRSAQRS